MTRDLIKRESWVSALNNLPAEDIIDLTNQLSLNWIIQAKAVPQSGLGMLKLNDSALNEPYYLGEFPLASAWLEIKTDDELLAEGAAQVMDDRVELAQALALCDAILSARLPGWEQVADLLDKGVEQQKAVNLQRKHLLAQTQVNFSLLDDADEKYVDETIATKIGAYDVKA